MESKSSVNSWYLVFAVLGILVLQHLWVSFNQIEVIPYSEFLREVEAGNVASIVVSESTIRGELKSPTQSGKSYFHTRRVAPDLGEMLAQKGIEVTGATEKTLLTQLLSWIVPALVFVGFWYFIIRRLAMRQGFGGGLMNIGKSKAKVYVESDTKVTFADVAGVDEAKAELEETVSFLKEPETYGRLGARIPKGILLLGPPGTGKTLLAKAVAGEAGVPFFSISGSEFVEMFVGVGAARVRDLFEQARQRAPCIIFIDELDALGRARGAFPGMGGHDEKEQTLNQLLVELDGFDPAKEGMVLLAATNRPEIIDPALLRAGRFDRHVLVDRPDRIGRKQILEVHVRKIKLDSEVDLDEVAGLTPGFSGAELANLVNEAALLATRRNADRVTSADFVAAIERIVAGLEKRNRLLNEQERRIVAYHEMGHALVAYFSPGADPVQKVSIIPRGVGALGYTIQRPTEDRYLMLQEELETKMAVLLGGRAAEKLVFGKLSTGAADDLSKATEIARSIVTRYGMSESLGEMVYETEPSGFLVPGSDGMPTKRLFSEQTAREIDCAVRELVDRSVAAATELLQAHRDELQRAAERLLEKETLSGAALEQILRPRPAWGIANER